MLENSAVFARTGINVIRLGVMWPGLEPVRRQYNHSYLDAVQSIVREAASYGIYASAHATCCS